MAESKNKPTKKSRNKKAKRRETQAKAPVREPGAVRKFLAKAGEVLANKWLKIVVAVVLPLLFFTYVFSIVLNYSLNDPDLWWHLKTGKYITDNWEVPDVDPFAYTTPRPLGESKKIGLRSQWLGQVFLYLSYNLGGYQGIGILRGLLIVLPMLFLYAWLVKKGLGAWTAVFVTSMSTLMLAIQLFYAFERPQGFSFFLSVIVIIMVERLREHSREGFKQGHRVFDISFVLLPLVTAFWSNIHAGFMVGNVIIIIYFMGEWSRLVWTGLKIKRPQTLYMIKALGVFAAAAALAYGLTAVLANKNAAMLAGKAVLVVIFLGVALRYGVVGFGERKKDYPYLKWFFIIAILTIFASFLNPNSYVLFYSYVGGLISKFATDISRTVGLAGGSSTGWVENVVLEYKSLYYFYVNLGYKWLTFYWLFTGLLYLLMAFKYWKMRFVDLAELVTVSFIAFFANYYARGLMFSLVILPIYMGKTLFELKGLLPNSRIVFRGAVALMLALTIGFSSYIYRGMPRAFKPGITRNWITPWYPTRLVEFLQSQDIPGPMYNFYTWGGFLIWTLYPQYQVFIDGRALNNMVNKTADSILKTYPSWREQLDAYNINFIVIPVVFRESGHIIPLARALIREDKWQLIFTRNNSAVFVRDVPQNQKYISKFKIDKRTRIYREIIDVENIFLSSSPRNPVNNLAKAEGLMGLGRYAEAKALAQKFPRRGARMLQSLKKMGY